MARVKEKLKGLGVKYGRTLRKRYSRVVALQKAKRSCPACGALRLRRRAAGIYVCERCGHEVAGGAYTV